MYVNKQYTIKYSVLMYLTKIEFHVRFMYLGCSSPVYFMYELRGSARMNPQRVRSVNS